MLNIKKIIQLEILIFSFIAALTAWADSNSFTHELVIENAFVPEVGYNDNNQVEIVIQGSLPNSCYSIEPKERVTRTGNVFLLQTRVFQGDPSACADRNDPQGTIPFSFVVSLGQLEVGDYEFKYTTSTGLDTAHFKIKKASWSGVDEEIYASIQSVNIENSMNNGHEVIAEVDGILVSDCSELIRPVQVQKQGHVFVVLPIANLKPGRNCNEVRRPFRERVYIGTVKKGEYLLHVRSREGKAILKPFTIKDEI